MKVYWFSNSPAVGSGYGVQTALFCQRLKAAGHDVVIRGNYGHNGNAFNWGGITVLPQWYDPHGRGVMALDIAHHKPDVSVVLYDAWVFDADDLAQMTAYAPIDHEPMPPLVAEKLHSARHVWAMSRFGERMMREVGLVPDYVPHGVDTAVYAPGDRDAARARWGVEPSQFFAVMVAANRGYPSRKSLDRVLLAWSRFVRTVDPSALLYIHTVPQAIENGIDLLTCAKQAGVPEKNIRFPDLYAMNAGQYTAERMAQLFNAADVLVAPSMGEGFGVPAIEAQACGCPVILTGFSAQAELCGGGWKIDVDPDDLTYTLQNSFMVQPKTTRIIAALTEAHEARGDKALRVEAREFALQYDADHVFSTYLMPALLRQVERERDLKEKRAARTAARLALRETAKIFAIPQVTEHEPAWT